MFRGALFDWDGTIVDSGAAHEESWMQLAREEHLHLTREMFQLSFGRTNNIIIPNAYKWTNDPKEIERLGERKEVIYREIIAKHGNAMDYALPGAIELLFALKEAGIPCAIGSSAPKENIAQLVDRLGIKDCFRAFITAEDVVHGKPDPEVFLRGAKAIGIDPADCVVFEDAVHGIEAGKFAGTKGVAVLTSHARESFVGKADLIVNRLTAVTLPMLYNLWASNN